MFRVEPQRGMSNLKYYARFFSGAIGQLALFVFVRHVVAQPSHNRRFVAQWPVTNSFFCFYPTLRGVKNSWRTYYRKSDTDLIVHNRAQAFDSGHCGAGPPPPLVSLRVC